MPTDVDFSGPYESAPTYLSESDWSLLIAAGRGDGVHYPDCEVTAGALLSIDIAPGSGVVHGHLFRIDSTINLAVTAPGGSDRKDTVVARSIPASDKVEVDIREGTPTTWPTLQQDAAAWETPLAYLDIPSGTTDIVAGHIETTRPVPMLPQVGASERFLAGDERAAHATLESDRLAARDDKGAELNRLTIGDVFDIAGDFTVTRPCTAGSSKNVRPVRIAISSITARMSASS